MKTSGWIILDKHEGIHSRTAGNRVRRLFDASTFGHIGTLDPMASGLLPIALGNATKMIPFWPENQPKEYLFNVQFGFETDTLDITGTKIRDTFVVPSEKQIVSVCKKLTGEYDQVPPQYSAVHVDGRRAYDIARSGSAIDIPPRRVTIHALELIGFDGVSWKFRVTCSPGTYVRSLARDMAELCGSLATVDMIRRVRTNGLDIKNAVKLDFLENLVNNGKSFEEYLKPVDFGLGDIPVWNLDKNDADVFLHGGFVSICDMKHGASDMDLRRIYADDKFIGIGYVQDGLLKPKRVLN